MNVRQQPQLSVQLNPSTWSWVTQTKPEVQTYLEHSIKETFSRPSVREKFCMLRLRSLYSSGGTTWNGKNGLNLIKRRKNHFVSTSFMLVFNIQVKLRGNNYTFKKSHTIIYNDEKDREIRIVFPIFVSFSPLTGSFKSQF